MRKRNLWPRILTWLLVLCLAVGVLPLQAMAISPDDDPSTWPAPDSHYTVQGKNPVYIYLDYSDEDNSGIRASHRCDPGAQVTADIVKATSTTGGHVKYTCSVCGSWAQVDVPALTNDAFTLDPAYQSVIDNGVEFSGQPYTVVYDVNAAYHRYMGKELTNHVAVTSAGTYSLYITVTSDIYDVKLLTPDRLVVHPKAVPWEPDFEDKVYDGTNLLDSLSVSYQDVSGNSVPLSLTACQVKVADGMLKADTASPVTRAIAAGPYAVAAPMEDKNYQWQDDDGSKYTTIYKLVWVLPSTNTIYVGDTANDVVFTTGSSVYPSAYKWTTDTSYSGFDSSKPGATNVRVTVSKSGTGYSQVLVPVTVKARPVLGAEEVVRSALMGTPFGSLNLPSTVTVTAGGGSSIKSVPGVPVTWSSAGYDPNTATQTITGTLDVSRFPQLSNENVPTVTATIHLSYASVEAPEISGYTKTYDGKATPLPTPSLPAGIKSVAISYKGTSNSGRPYSSATPPTDRFSKKKSRATSLFPNPISR